MKAAAPQYSRMLLAIAIALVFAFLAHSARADLVVYTYDSIAAKDGLGPVLAEAFKKKTGIPVKFITVGDAGQLLSRIQLDAERKKKIAHVVLGLDQNLFGRLKDSLVPLDPTGEASFMKFVDREWWIADAFVPFDYGVGAFIADTKKIPVADFPKKWSDLLKGRFKKSLLLEDPRTSSPGLAFVWGSLHAAAAAAGEVFPPVSTEDHPATPKKTRDGFAEFWRDLRPQWITLAPGWSQAYGMFLKGDAPLVWSYLTSEAYHRTKANPAEPGEGERYRAVLFTDGNPVQVEGAAMLKNAPGGAAMRKATLTFLELLTSDEIQKRVPETQWMMPVRLGVRLPPAFQALPTPPKRFSLESPPEKIDDALADWSAAIR